MQIAATLILFILCISSPSACSAASKVVVRSTEIVLIGSTPGGVEMKQILGIDAGKSVDFIRWELKLSGEPGPFQIHITFGEGEPNTRGFKGGGETRELVGSYAVVNGIYKLSGDKLSSPLFLADLDSKVFHFLTHDKKLMNGTGGWSYSLARRDQVAGTKRTLQTLSKSVMKNDVAEMVFDGRTPCVDLGRRELPHADGCLKLKWRLRLTRDAASRTIGKYALESTLNRRRIAEGRWAFVNGTRANPNALLIQLDLDQPHEPISFLVGDENVIFFLDKNERLLAGNEDFGFTLNRRQ